MNQTFRWKIAQITELKWWKNYLKNKDVQSYLSWKKNYWNNLLTKIDDVVNLKGMNTVLDAGCGPAGIFIVLENYQVDAVDPLIERYENH